MLLNHRHRVAGVDHFRKNNELGARVFRERSEIANLTQVRAETSEHTGNLGSRNFHLSILWRQASRLQHSLNAAEDNASPARTSLHSLR